MDQSYTIYMAIHGFCFGIMFMLGFYLLTSVRSAYCQDIESNLLVRRNAGYNALLWAFTFGVSMLNMVWPDTAFASMYPALDTMASLLVVPGIVSFLLCLLQMQKILHRYFWLHLLVPVGIIIWYLFDPQLLCLYLATIYWVIYALCSAVWFIRMERKYYRRLQDLYSDMEYHDISWIYHFVALFLIYFVLFLIGHLDEDNYVVLYASYFFCLILWMRLVYHVDRYENITLFWPSENAAVQETVESPVATSVAQDEDKPSPATNGYDWIGSRLQKQCEDTGLFLRQDLNVDALASHVGTNRTYISRYLTSKGLTYYTYINSLRINHAKRLMSERTDVVISDIAFQSGFKSASTFRRAFLDIEKCTPSEYLKRR